jgi:hypothetical protein
MPDSISSLERGVLGKLLEGDLPELSILRAQLSSSRVRRREWTGVGFWTDFDVDKAAPRLASDERFHIAGVYAKHPQLRAGIGFDLTIEGGRLDSLEGYTFEEPWPEDLSRLELEQEPSGELRLAQLAKLLQRQDSTNESAPGG